MGINNFRKLFNSFVRVFIVLFVILIVLPWVLDRLVHYFGGGMAPGNDSIRVFKYFAAGRAALSRFFDVFKKIVLYM